MGRSARDLDEDTVRHLPGWLTGEPVMPAGLNTEQGFE